MYSKYFNLTALSALFISVSTQASPLTTDQKQIALSTFQSAFLGVAVAQSLDPLAEPGKPGRDAVSQKFVQMLELLASSCQMPPQSYYHTFKVLGPNCPINLDDKPVDPPTDANTHTDTTTYKVVNPSYAAMTDVDSVKINLTMSMPDDGSISFQGDGSFHSQKMGALLGVTITGKGTADLSGEAKLLITLEVQFPGFVALLRENADTSSGNSYLLNGASLTQDEVDTYITPPYLTNPNSLYGPIGMFLVR